MGDWSQGSCTGWGLWVGITFTLMTSWDWILIDPTYLSIGATEAPSPATRPLTYVFMSLPSCRVRLLPGTYLVWWLLTQLFKGRFALVSLSIDILDYINGIGNGCIFAQSTPSLLVGTETSILTTPIHFSVDRLCEISAKAAGLSRCKLIQVTRTSI